MKHRRICNNNGPDRLPKEVFVSKNRVSFQQILDLIETLPGEQQETLIDIIKRRLIDLRRTELAVSIKETRTDYKKGNVKSGSVGDIMKDLGKELNMIEFHVLIEKEDKLFSALCLELNVASQGHTLIEAEKNIGEAITLYLEDVYEARDEKDFIPRPAPVSEWLKYFKKDAENLKTIIKNRNIKPRFKEVVVG
jgi:predicted RNase H-like HicB family nuclease